MLDGRLVSRSDSYLLKGLEVTHPCSYRRTCLLLGPIALVLSLLTKHCEGLLRALPSQHSFQALLFSAHSGTCKKIKYAFISI